MKQCFMTGQHQSVSLRKDGDGNQDLMLHFLPVVSVAKSIWEDPSHSDVMNMAPEVLLDRKGERILFDFSSGETCE